MLYMKSGSEAPVGSFATALLCALLLSLGYTYNLMFTWVSTSPKHVDLRLGINKTGLGENECFNKWSTYHIGPFLGV